ncbi:MAG: hypothetical protein AABX51_05885 [Nanoarchaeota archaeon]
MRIIEYRDVNCSPEASSQAAVLSKLVMPELERDYKLGLPSDYVTARKHIRDQLEKILTVLDGNLDGKRILDLGCGAPNSFDNYDPLEFGSCRQFEPWLCRALSEFEHNPSAYDFKIGPHPIGIDISHLDHERFERYRVDISVPGSLNVVIDHSIDLVNVSELLGSATLNERIGKDYKSFRATLLDQTDRVLKPEGILLFDGPIYE